LIFNVKTASAHTVFSSTLNHTSRINIKHITGWV